MTFVLLTFRLKQIIPQTVGALLKFLAPDILVGTFLALSSGGEPYFEYRFAVVAAGVTLFTLMVETRKIFFSGGDVENFYFVQPTIGARVASVLAVISLDLLIVASVMVPAFLISVFRSDYSNLAGLVLASSLALCSSAAIYFIFLSMVSVLPPRVSNIFLTFQQILMALILLSAFQLSAGVRIVLDLVDMSKVAMAVLMVSSLLFVIFPFFEKLISRLVYSGPSAGLDLSDSVKTIGKLLLIRSEDEEAGFIIFLSNLFRAPSFRLSTIGTAAPPVVVAIYWSVQNMSFMRFDWPGYFVTANLVAPIASLVVSGVLVMYFLSNGLLNSRDHEAKWLFVMQGRFDVGKFIVGVRRSLSLTVHIPTTILIFFVIILRNSFLASATTAITYYIMVRLAASWFIAMQRGFPFTVPFARIGEIENVNLIFMFAYSFLVIVVLYFSYGDIIKLLMVNLSTLILVSLLESFSSRIISRRVRVSG